jgi:hypothetical protein
MRGGICRGVVDSLIVGFSLPLGFWLDGMLFSRAIRHEFVAAPEMAFISLALASCYGFVFVLRRSYASRPVGPWKTTLKILAANIVFAYLMEMSLLFVIKDDNFAVGQLTLALAVISGFALLLASRFLPFLKSRSNRPREGKKQLIIKAGPAALSKKKNRISLKFKSETTSDAMSHEGPEYHPVDR